MNRPYVICHMMPSIDGRIVTKHWDLPSSATGIYEKTAQTFGADAWIIGRISMEPYAGKAKVPRAKVKTPIPRTDFIAKRAKSYAIAIDPSGKLRWEQNDIDGEHFVTILTDGVSDEYLAFLRERGVSYFFGGKDRIDLKKTLEKLRRELRIRKLLLEGGGKINGTFLAANVIDELSILVAPLTDGTIGTPALFDVNERRGAVRNLKLVAVEKLKGGVVWLRYKMQH